MSAQNLVWVDFGCGDTISDRPWILQGNETCVKKTIPVFRCLRVQLEMFRKIRRTGRSLCFSTSLAHTP